MVYGSWLRVSCFEFRFSCLVFRVSYFVSRVSRFGFRVSYLVSRVSGFGFRVAGFRFRVSYLVSRVSSFGFRVWYHVSWVSGFRFRVSGMVAHVSDELLRDVLEALGGPWQEPVHRPASGFQVFGFSGFGFLVFRVFGLFKFPGFVLCLNEISSSGPLDTRKYKGCANA